MQDLNDKVTGNTLTATEWNQVPSEIQNVVESLGIALSGADLNQLGKAIAGYVANGDYYTDSGAADAYVLAPVGSKQAPTAYTNGMMIRFLPGNANTGASTVNVGGLGVKTLANVTGGALTAGDLSTAVPVTFAYSTGAGHFRKVYPAFAERNVWGKAQDVAQVTLTDAANIATDAALSNVFSVTLAGNRTLNNPTNLIAGQVTIWNIDQDATGARTLAYGTLYKFPGGVAPVLSTVASAKDTLTGVYDGTILRCSIQKGFA